MLQLAIADTLFLMTIPFRVSERVKDEWIQGETMCKAVEVVLYLNCSASILFLMVSKCKN